MNDRDEFAAAALACVFDDLDAKNTAKRAYAVADAMLIERERTLNERFLPTKPFARTDEADQRVAAALEEWYLNAGPQPSLIDVCYAIDVLEQSKTKDNS